MKRAFVDVTLELLTQLLHLNDDVMVIHVENRFEQGAMLRLHLRGDGLPDKTNQMEGAPATCIDLREVLCNTTSPCAGDRPRPDMGKCARCDNPLDNLSPGFGIFRNATYCMACLNAMGVEPDARAR
jgi:hypothetical protein